LPTAPGYGDVSIQLKHNLMARPAFITFGIKPIDTDPMVMAQAVRAAWNDTGSMNASMDSNVSVGPFTVRYGVDGEEDHIGVDSTTVSGALTNTTAPPNIAVLMIKNTARAGRRGKGRMYMPWVVNFGYMQENGVIQASEMTTIRSRASAFLGALATRQVPMYVLHNPSEPTAIHPTAMGAPNLVTSLTVQDLVSTQRRRLGR
jgi:hypothetical protein